MNRDNDNNNQPGRTVQATRRRNTRGNFLILSSVCFAIACVTLLMGYSFASLFFVNNRLQCSADEIALAGAKKLNDKDRIGQINNMTVRCRQLVYSSRQDLDDTIKIFPDLKSFAEPLLDEARESAKTLSSERKRVAQLAEIEATQAMQQRFNDIKGTYAMTLPWLRVGTPRLAIIKFGKIDEVESNVEQLKGFVDLDKNDETKQLITDKRKNAKAMILYKSETPDALRLPTVDSDLDFQLSSLPAPVDGIIAPARVMLAAKRKNHLVGCAPSVAQVSLDLKVDTGIGFKAGGNMRTTGVASTTGAGIQE